jgi:hypothetical protein
VSNNIECPSCALSLYPLPKLPRCVDVGINLPKFLYSGKKYGTCALPF